MPRGVATLATLGVTALVVGCSEARQTEQASGRTSPATSNERTLTHAQSVRLVQWATTYRQCMDDEGWALGELVKTPTHLAMSVPKAGDLSKVLTDSVACGDAQGGPPAKSSLQYRGGTMFLYLPERCLLDPKVAST